MATYRYICSKCGNITSFPLVDRSNPTCCCEVMQPYNIPIPIAVVVKISGREQVLKTLNKEEGGYSFPGGDMHRPRYEQAMAKSLDLPKKVVGRGFG